MDKQKQIEEMAMKLIMAGDLCRRIKDCDRCKYNHIVGSELCEAHLMAEELLKYYQPKPENTVGLTEYENEQLKILKSVFDIGCAFKLLSLQKKASDWELEYLDKKKDFEHAQEQIAKFIAQVDELKSENAELYKEHTTLIAGSILEKQNIIKDTAKDLLIDFNEWINEYDDAKFDDHCVRIPVDKVSEFLIRKAKEYGIFEVE